jgi:serine protease AprX
MLAALASKAAGWDASQGACTRCLDQAQLGLCEWPADSQPGLAGGYTILPIPQRLGAGSDYQGAGITICFIDSGFAPHPDLCQPQGRILRTFDIRRPGEALKAGSQPEAQCWHGTMTAVAGAGNGWLSGGYYQSLAPAAQVLLIRVMDAQGSISSEAIAAALDWVLRNHRSYGIRIVNLSVSGDEGPAYRQSPAGRLIEALSGEGVLVVAAAGNEAGARLKMPASAPHALTVGGLDDHNTLHPLSHSLYHSSYGETADRTFKPDLIAPAIWLPVPLLPGSGAQAEAEALFAIGRAEPRYRPALAANLLGRTRLPHALLRQGPEHLLAAVEARIKEAKYISPHYQHADGTSFAAPIVCGTAAQMLEARPTLGPAELRDLLLRTARPLPGLPAERQGFGVLHPFSAVHLASKAERWAASRFSPLLDYRSRRATFHFQHPSARSVALLGAFNGWAAPGIPLAERQPQQWEASIELPAPALYPYKFQVDGHLWESDTRNLYRAPDGRGGFNSLLWVEAMRPG